jgi:hypothetical protein
MTPQQVQYIKIIALAVLSAAGAGLAAYQQANPAAVWVGGAIAVVSAITAGLVARPKDAAVIAEQDGTINRLSKRLDDISSADRSRK